MEATDSGETGGTVWVAVFFKESDITVREVLGESLWAQIEGIKQE